MQQSVDRRLILGWNPDKNHKSFPTCYLQSPLQLCLEIFISSNSRTILSISSNSRNLLHISTVKLLYTVKEKGGQSDRKPYPLSYCLINPYRSLKSENSQDYAQKPQLKCTFMNLASVCMVYQVRRLCCITYVMTCEPVSKDYYHTLPAQHMRGQILVDCSNRTTLRRTANM